MVVARTRVAIVSAARLLQFPEPLTERYKPLLIKDFIGIDKVRKVMNAFVARPYNSAWLYLGHSGVGKTSMAMAVAQELGAELHHLPSRKCDLEELERVCAMCHYVPMRGLNSFHLILIDEADQATKAAQLALLSKLDGTANLPRCIFIFTANSTNNMEERFLSRCRVLLFEQDQLAKELPAFLRKVFKRECGKTLDNSKQLAAQSGFNVRDALSNLEIELLSKGRRR
jgi:replication-associated recombination protein RarA